MTNQTEFDKELKKVSKLAQIHVLPFLDSQEQDAYQKLWESYELLIKQAVDTYVIPKVKHTLAEIQDLNKNLDSTSQKHWYSYSEGYIKAVDESRLALWGDK